MHIVSIAKAKERRQAGEKQREVVFWHVPRSRPLVRCLQSSQPLGEQLSIERNVGLANSLDLKRPTNDRNTLVIRGCGPHHSHQSRKWGNSEQKAGGNERDRAGGACGGPG